MFNNSQNRHSRRSDIAWKRGAPFRKWKQHLEDVRIKQRDERARSVEKKQSKAHSRALLRKAEAVKK